MDQIADLYVMLRANTHGFTAALSKAGAEAEGFTGRIQHGMKTMAAFGVYGTAALIGIGVAAVKMGSDFQASIQRVSTLAMGGKGNIKQLENGVLALAGQVGYSPNSLSEALYHIESNFYSVGLGGKQAFDALKVAAEGAQVGGANLVDVTNALGAAVASGIPGVQNYKTAMQQMLTTVGSGDMTMQNLADAFGTGLLAIGKQFGVTFTDMGAALATFGDNNIRGQKAATELRMAIQDMAKQAKPGVEALAKLGIKAGQLGADMRSGGLNKALTDLRDHLIAAKIPAKEWGKVMLDAFTKKAGAPMALLLGQFDRLQSKYRVLTKGAGSFGSAWKARLGTVQQQVDNLKGKFEAWLTELGLKLMPIATKALSGINKGLDWMGKHQGAVKILAAAIAGPLAVGLGIVAFEAASAAVSLAITWAPVMALAAGIYLLWTHCKQFRQIVRAVGSALKVALGASLNWIAHTALPWLEKAAKKVFGWLQHTALPALKAAWKATFNAISGVVKSVVAWLEARFKEFQAFWKQHGQEITQIAKAAWDAIKAVIQVTTAVIIAAAKVAWTGFKDSFKFIWDLIKDVVKIAINLIKDTIEMGWHLILNTVGLFADLLTGKWSKLWGDVKKLVGQGISDIKRVISDFASGAINLLFDAGKNVIKGLMNGIGSMIGGLKGILHSVTSLIPFHKGPPSKDRKLLYANGVLIMQGLMAGMSSQTGGVTEFLDGLTSTIGANRHKGGWAAYWRHHPHHHRHITHHHRVSHHHKHVETPAEKAKKAEEARKRAARKRAEEARKRAEAQRKKVHEYLQRLLDAMRAREHQDITARTALSRFVTAHNGKHFTAAGKAMSMSRWKSLDAHDATVLAQAIALQTRIDHNKQATSGEKRSAAARVAEARRQMTEMSQLLNRIYKMQGIYHKTVTDHIKKVESRRNRRLGARQAMEEDQMTYLAAMSAAGRLGHNTPFHPVRLNPRWPVKSPFHTGPPHVPHSIIHTHVHIDGREIAHVVQKATLRRENRNTSNGLSRYNRR